MNYRALVLVPVLALFGFGCKSPSQMIAEKATEGYVNSQLGGKGKVDVNGNAVTYQGADGSSVSYGEDVTLPTNFPKEVLVYTGSKIKAVSTNAGGGANATLVYETGAEPSAVMLWYVSEMTKAGWKKGDTATMNGTEYATFEKGTEKMTVTASKVDAGSSVSIALETQN